MKKKVYVQPSVAVYEMEVEPILAGSEPIKSVNATVDDDPSEGLGWGGDTKADGTYSPD